MRARTGSLRRGIAYSLVAATAASSSLPSPAHARLSCKRKAGRVTSSMHTEALVGQMTMVAVLPAGDGSPSLATKRMIASRKVGAVIVFGASGPYAAAKANNRMQRWAARTRSHVPLLVAADNEFGAAHRVPHDTTVFPLAMGIGATRRADDARAAAAITAREARAMGFNWSLAPVADVNTNPRNPVIGVRSFGSRARLVGRMVKAEVIGFQREKVIATPKHFPGHGATSVDSHTGLPVVYYGRRKLERIHLAPFRAAIRAGARSIMTGHVIVKSVDPRHPATLSHKVLTGILRKKLDYRGLIVTDDMTMDAISEHYGSGRAAVLAARAGADVIMVTGSISAQNATLDGLIEGVRSHTLPRRKIKKAARRVIAAKCRLGLWGDRYVRPGRAPAKTGRAASRRTAARIARRSITLVKNKRDLLPFKGSSRQRTLVTGVMHTARLAETARRLARGSVDEYELPLLPTDAQIDEAVRRARRVDRVIVATFSRTALPAAQARLVNRLRASGSRTVALSLGLPYDIKSYPRVKGYIATYAQGPWPSVVAPPLRAAVKVIFGVQPGGKLPVKISRKYRYGRGLHY